jgi:hypothetical protein
MRNERHAVSASANILAPLTSRSERIAATAIRVRPQHLNGVGSARLGVGRHRRQYARLAMRVSQQVVSDPERIAAERPCVVPAFAEGEFQVPDGRPLDRQLSVMPWRSVPVHGRHRLALAVAVMVGVVAPAVAEVDPANEGNVALRAHRVADDDELLMMRPAKSYALVEEDLGSGFVALLSEMPVLFGAEAEPIQVGPPEQSLDDDTAARRGREDGADRRIGIVAQQLVGIAAPVGEVDPVTGAKASNRFQEPAVVGGSVHERFDLVARAPGETVRSPAVELGEIVAALGGREKPTLERRGRLFLGWHRTKIPSGDQRDHPLLQQLLSRWVHS